MSADDIRKTLNLINESVQHTAVDEAAPMGLLKKLSTAAGSLFSDLKLGELDTGASANKMYNLYSKYLGRIGSKPGTETVGDLYDFLKASNLSDDVIFKGMSKSLSTPTTLVDIKDKADLQNWYDTAIKTDYKNKIGKVFLDIMSQKAKEAYTKSSEDDTTAAPPSAAPPAIPSADPSAAPMSDAELTKLIQSIKGSSAAIAPTELNTWRAQLSAAGLHK